MVSLGLPHLHRRGHWRELQQERAPLDATGGRSAPGNGYCGDAVTTACGLVPEPSKGKGIYSLLYTASGKCSSGTCESENVCRAFPVNTAEQ